MHLRDEQLSAYLAGALPPPDEAAFEAHVDACEACRVRLSEFTRLRFAEQPPSPLPLDRALPVSVGDIVLSRFRIERLLGIGGMGCVYEATHLTLNQRVALKFMLPELAKDRSVAERFVREARAAVRLVTPHVGRVLDLGTLDDGTPCMIMELLQGETVEHRLAREGPFAPHVAVEWVCQALEALEEAHALGIVHRDLKPANLFLARRSNGTELLKVLDFGIAKSIHPDIEAGLGATSQKTLLGSPLYMAPEQLTPGHSVDARVDLWAMGCTLQQMLTGTTPFRSADLVELMYSIQKVPHVPVSRQHGSLRPFDAILSKCLAKLPDDRPPSAAALRAELRGVLHAPASAVVEAGRAQRWGPLVLLAGVVVAAFALFMTRSTLSPASAVERPAAAPIALEPLPPVAVVPVTAPSEPLDAGSRAEPTAKRPAVKKAATTPSAPHEPKVDVSTGSPAPDLLDERL